VVFVTITINLFFILFKSNNNITVDDYGHRVVLPASLGGGALCALITWFIVIPYLKVRVTREQEEHDAATVPDVKSTEGLAGMEEGSEERREDSTSETDNKKDSYVNEEMIDASPKETLLKDPISGARNTMTASLRATWNKVADNTYNQDLETQSFAENSKAKAIWDNSSIYDAKTERLFSYLQVFTACMTSFAHGSNDIANAIAPVSAVLDIYKTGKFDSHASVHEWVLALGGIGIVLGLALYGYNIMRAVGLKLTCITPSRGFCIELATALAVSLASYMQIPVSSTQCLVGATVGAGIASGGFKQVQWFFLFRVATGWVGTFFITAVVTAGLFSFATYSPSL
jgi:sodium-dependent phosphate transporter